MRASSLLTFLLPMMLPAAVIADPMSPGMPLDPQQQQYQQQLLQQYQQQFQQPAQQVPPQYPTPQEQQPYPQGQQDQQQFQQPAPQTPQQYQPMPQGIPAAGASPQSGPCTVKLSNDRSTIYLANPDGTERRHVPLGQDRVQKVFNSPDGTWSVAIFKIRGAPQYGFVALDLANCEEQLPVDVPSVARSAVFEQGEVVLTFDAGERRFKLKNQVIE
ncbi:MAG TPA: hypothetical protein VFF01_05815 [Candidatus Deferrimicrobiaceae bacterium]|nr:hypothetical protein [Candidatus Deferrimicrobiaceae bacterium]